MLAAASRTPSPPLPVRGNVTASTASQLRGERCRHTAVYAAQKPGGNARTITSSPALPLFLPHPVLRDFLQIKTIRYRFRLCDWHACWEFPERRHQMWEQQPPGSDTLSSSEEKSKHKSCRCQSGAAYSLPIRRSDRRTYHHQLFVPGTAAYYANAYHKKVSDCCMPRYSVTPSFCCYPWNLNRGECALCFLRRFNIKM